METKKSSEVLKDVQEFINLSKQFMSKLDLLQVNNIPPQHIKLTRDMAIKVREKAYLYLCSGRNNNLM